MLGLNYRLPVALLAVALLAACTGRSSTKTGTAHIEVSARAAGDGYVGSAVCGNCHAQHYDLWKGSMHAIAMRRVDVAQAPGIGPNTVHVAWGRDATGSFAANDGALSLNVDEPGVGLRPYAVPYLLGGRYIAQYLAEMDDGRLQALAVGFDPIKGDWFDIFADSPRDPEDWGHWANRGMTANSECIACHVTGFHKGYDARTDTYETSWSETGVGCEACHGPGARHVGLRREAEGNQAAAASERYLVPEGRAMIDGCATCHALRRQIRDTAQPGTALLDSYEPVLLEDADYQVDGQVSGEDYEWASFAQSRMYAQGVTCLDCHDVHTGELRAAGNALCVRCHEQGFATAEHTHHQAGTAGAACVGCHMPEHVYMQRDRRRDHKLVVPDPELSVLTGVRDPCRSCHEDRDSSWAADKVAQWFATSDGGKRGQRRQVAVAFAKGRRGDPGALEGLRVCGESCPAPIRRASALKLLAGFAADERARAALLAAVGDDNALVRYTATWALAEGCAESHADCRRALLAAADDPLRVVRMNAAWGLRGLRLDGLSHADRSVIESAVAELEASLAYRNEYAETRQTRGALAEAIGDLPAAEAAYRAALRLAPESIVPRYRLAVLLARRGELDDAQAELEDLIADEPELAPAHYALGLIYGEQGNWREAVRSLTECLKLEAYYPDALHELAHSYVALGEAEIARKVLTAALHHPRARTEALRTLVSVNLELGDRRQARTWARRAAAEIPGFADQTSVRELLEK